MRPLRPAVIACLARLFIALAAVASGTAFAAAGDTVELFSPQGTVKGVRQASARFAAPMVPFGDPRRVDPFTIDCPVKGRGRWADMKNWVYDFDADLPAGVRCSFTVAAGLTAVDGTPVAGGQQFAFGTGGPAILRSLPYEGGRIDENQVFILGLDAPADAASIAAHAYCTAAGIHERIGVRIVGGDERRTILDNRKSFAASWLRLVLVDPDTGRSRAFAFALPPSGSDEDKFRRLRDAPDSPLVTLACARTLPAGADMKLVWGKGVATTTGIAAAADQALAFKVQPAFRAAFTCERVNRNAQCLSILPLNLTFTAPIARRDAAQIRLVGATGTVYPAKLPKGTDGDAVEAVSFGPGLPEQATFRLELPAGLKDDAGRPLTNAATFPLKVQTDALPPLAKFPGDFGILEARLPDGATPLLPVTVRNLEPVIAGVIGTAGPKGTAAAAPASATPAPPAADGTIPGQIARVRPGEEMKVVDWLRRIDAGARIEREWDEKNNRSVVLRHGGAQSIFTGKDAREAIGLPKPLGAKAFEVIGIPLAAPGFYVVELASPRLGAALFGVSKPYYVRTSTLVTNLGVHFKLGRESSLAWVTALADGKPVAKAEVNVRDCSGRSYWKGTTDASGIARIAQALPRRELLPKCTDGGRNEYFVTARVGADFAFAFSDWGEGISPWRFNVPTASWSGPFVAHAVLDRTLVRNGETVSMKLFVRRQTGDGFALVARAPLADTLQVRHRGSDRKFAVPVQWQGTQHGEATFAVPADAPTGSYEIFVRDSLAAGSKEVQERRAGEFRVEAFRVPLLRARMQAVGAPFVNPAAIDLDVQVNYLAGGGAGGLPVKLRTQQSPRVTTFPDFEDYRFAAGNVTEGREESGDEAGRFDMGAFDDDDSGDDTAADGARGNGRTGVRDQDLKLDAAGGARASIRDLGRDVKNPEVPRDLVAELEYRDPNGETLTAATRVPIWPSRILLAIRPDSWAASKERLKFTVAAVDVTGKPMAGVKIRADAFKRDYYSHRRRLIGGFYAYDHGSETTRLKSDLCVGQTDAHGLLICDVAPPAAGNLILRAQAADAAGNAAVTRADAWVAADDEWSFAASDNDRVDLLPEAKRYEPGQTARFQVRTPFQTATVLVTVEREGVLESFVRTVSRTDPTIEVPVRGSYAPNVFVSALLVRGRIGGIAPTALVDLAKPAYKMGLAEIRVGWAAHELAVTVTPDKATYPVRAKAAVTIAVRRPDGSAPPKGTEVALAAVDEGLLELLPNDSWKLLDAMMTRRGEEVETATAQMQVIGRRHFGRKAVPAGGGGGRASARELFDTLLLWTARVPVDDAGNAAVEIPLNDSLTGFRIVAVASAGTGLFGTGQASIRSTQDLMLLAGLPPLVREGDRFRAGITVRNASPQPLAVGVTAQVAAGGGRAVPTLAAQDVTLAAGEARDLGWDLVVPVGTDRLDWQFAATGTATGATGAADSARDAVKFTQRVVAAVPERTYQATLFQLTEPRDVVVERPADALPGRGGVFVRMQEKLSGDLPGVREFLERYPFTCFEQQASVAVGLRDRRRWDALMRTLPGYLDRDGLVRYFTLLRDGDDTLTAYVLAIGDEAGWKIPDEARAKMEAGLRGFVEGRVVRYGALPTADLTIRKVAALAALARGKEAIKPALLESIAVEPNLWPTSAVIDWYLLQKRQPALPRRAERMKEAMQILRSRLNFQGTTMGFSTEKTDALWWLMVSADSNANRLLLAMEDAPEWREDIPRLATGTLGRMQRGRWNTTVANAWGVLALDRFAQRFETAPVTGSTTATLAAERFTHTWQPNAGVTPFVRKLAWPAAKETLALRQDGTGAPWVTLSSVAAIPLKAPLSSGYRIARSVTPVQQAVDGKWRRGDVLRVRLEIDAQSDMTWVVVSDPIPAGSTVLGRGLGGDSALQVAGEQSRGAVWPAFEERTFDGFRGYYRFVPKGAFVVEYTVRLNNPGTFSLPPTRVEAMYAPEMFGEAPNADVAVQE